MDLQLKIKHQLLTRWITLPLVVTAYQTVKCNNSKVGADRVSIECFAQQLDQNLIGLMRDLKQGTFQPRPASHRYVDKRSGKLIPLTTPAVRDRVAEEALRRLLCPLFEPEFHNNSYGFRPGRSCHTALEGLMEIWREGYRHVLDVDISRFCDNIPHAVIMRGLTNVVADGNVLNLVYKFLAAGVMEEGGVKSTAQGVSQGGLSPLLANIALNFLDWHLERLGLRFIRYGADLVVLCRTEHETKEVQAQVDTFLATLGLSPRDARQSSGKNQSRNMETQTNSLSASLRA